MYCFNCGEELVDGLTVCPFCKTTVKIPQKIVYENVSDNYRNHRSYRNYGTIGTSKIIRIIAGIMFGIMAYYGISYATTTYKDSKSVSYAYEKSVTLKNYQQIYDEYSQKLIMNGSTASIPEMAEILNEGMSKMTEYMYSASGKDGQYETYEEWGTKLFDVYLENCR